jgi:hypothetical protein
MDVWVHGDLAYVPITKNASTTYTQLFAGLGWKRTQLDLISTDIKLFGHFRDPIQRHFQGTAEFLIQNSITRLMDDPAWQQVWAKAVMDMHSYPVTWAMGDHARRCHWIPIHEKLDTDALTKKYLASHGVKVDHIPWLNVRPWHKKISSRLMELHKQIDPHNHLSYFYDSDIVLWNSLFPYVDVDNQWHTTC